jgi:hypothetical protein
MTTTCDPLVFDLVQWVAREPRTYAEVIDAWKTSCPRLTIWEDAIDQGFITRKNIGARGTIVVITGAGRALLEGRPTSSANSAENDATPRTHEPAL